MVWPTKELMRDLHIAAGNAFQHHYGIGRDCPRALRGKAFIEDRIDWKYFTTKIREQEEEVTQGQFNQMMDNVAYKSCNVGIKHMADRRSPAAWT